MIYNDFHGKKLSALGLGCMRLPHTDSYADIDVNATRKMIAYAIENGINYFDTAWGYHGGNSEPIMGEILSEYPRDSFFLATKFPGYDLENFGKAEEIFEAQIKRCRVDYFDFYLFHSVTEKNIDSYLNPDFRTYEYLVAQKKKGRIHHLGFSAHADVETMERFINAFGENIDFCQIQLNWLDYEFQDARAKVALLNKHGIPVWVMEPLRGGRLCKLSSEHEARLSALREGCSVTEWAFRFLESIPGVTLTLSGMSNFEQLEENIRIFSERKPLNEQEISLLLEFGREITAKNTLACTNCRYCTEHCPMNIDIPAVIKLYNKGVYSGGVSQKAIEALDEGKRPTDCIGCASCETVCPQAIKISDMMAEISEQLK